MLNADTFAGRRRRRPQGQAPPVPDQRPGVLDNKTESSSRSLGFHDIRGLIAIGRPTTGGMIPKVETYLYALERGVEGVVILHGKVPHAGRSSS